MMILHEKMHHFWGILMRIRITGTCFLYVFLVFFRLENRSRRFWIIFHGLRFWRRFYLFFPSQSFSWEGPPTAAGSSSNRKDRTTCLQLEGKRQRQEARGKGKRQRQRQEVSERGAVEHVFDSAFLKSDTDRHRDRQEGKGARQKSTRLSSCVQFIIGVC